VYGRPEGEDIGRSELTYDEMAAAVVEAHRRGLRVAAHAVGRDGIRDAVAAGVDTVEHGNFLDEEIAEDMARTAVAGHQESFRMAQEAGLDIVAGTDAGSCRTHHPALVDELLLMHAYGMPTDAVLRATTSAAGKVLGRQGTVGVVRPGSTADLLVLQGSPLADLEQLRSPLAVIRAGSPVGRGPGTWPKMRGRPSQNSGDTRRG